MTKHPWILIIICLLTPSLSFAWAGKVVRVADVDTNTVERQHEQIRVRLYVIDTPEKSQWYGQNAKQFTSAQVMGKRVEVEEIDIDRYGRVVGVVSVWNLILNRQLIAYA